jgi:hypothetical protein
VSDAKSNSGSIKERGKGSPSSWRRDEFDNMLM